MKRRELERHLAEHGCRLFREGSRHSVFYNPQDNSTSAAPRHREIDDFLARKICRDLKISPPK